MKTKQKTKTTLGGGRKYYTILLGTDIWENIIDDMNTTEIWAMGGMLWKSKKKALACLKDLQGYDLETRVKKFSIKQMYFIPPLSKKVIKKKR